MRIAIACDGGFVMKVLAMDYQTGELAKRVHNWLYHEVPQEFEKATRRAPVKLFRIYYYDCFPYQGKLKNPFTKVERKVLESSRAVFLNTLSVMQGVFFRGGELFVNGWRLAAEKRAELRGNSSIVVTGKDFEPIYQQKGVDIKLALDAQQLVTSKTVDAMIFITGDADFVPLFGWLRNNGMLVYLMPLGQMVAQPLLASVDGIIDGRINLSKDKR